ncbi:MAG: SH3 domain-containing protein [Gemmatimonadales bacterium]
MPSVTDAPQSSPASARLPAFLLALMLLANSAAASQERATSIQAGPFQRSPSGVQLGSILAGAPVVVDSTAGNWRRIVLEGWIFTASTRTDRREGFDLSVRAAPTENLRIEPNGTIIARLAEGALLHRVRTRGGWTLVRREGWVPSRTLPQDRTIPVAAITDYVPDTSRVEVSAPTTLMQRPEGNVVGTLAEGATAQVLARSGEWTRIRVEGWVHRDSLRPVAGGALVGVTAAEVRANPELYLGRDVDWKLQFVAIQTADELRPEIPIGHRYLLTRGPAPEAGFVYVVIDQAELGRFRSLQPLQDLMMRVRILASRTKYLPNPVVQLLAVLETEP